MPNLTRVVPWLPKIPRYQRLVRNSENISLEKLNEAVQSAKRFAEANIAIDNRALDVQHKINAVAMKEIDILKKERRELLLATSKLLEKFDGLKIKYDGLLEKYKYLKKKHQ